jgi:hypothetical protein
MHDVILGLIALGAWTVLAIIVGCLAGPWLRRRRTPRATR